MIAITTAAGAASKPTQTQAIARECVLAGLVAFGLFITMVGLRTNDQGGLDFRFWDVGVAVVLVMIGRLGMALTRVGYPLPVLIGGGVMAVIGVFIPLPSLVLQIIMISGAVVLSFAAANAMRVPMTVLVMVAFSALILAIVLNVLSAFSSVLEILMIWYGGLALAVGLTTRPRAGRVEGGDVIGVPVRTIAALLIGAVALAVILGTLAMTDRSVTIETVRGDPVVVIPPAGPVQGESVTVPTTGGEMVTLPVVDPRRHEGPTVRLTGPEGQGIVTVAEADGQPMDARFIGLIILFYALCAIGVIGANRYQHVLAAPDTGRSPIDLASPTAREIGRYAAVAALLLAVLFPVLYPDRSVIDLATLVLTYVMLGWGLNIVVGLAGLLDLGYVAFYAVGAYSYALLAVSFDLSFWVCLPLAGLLAALAGLLLGFPVLRLRGDYFAIVTLAFGEIIRLILLNWANFTGGPNGIAGIPPPSFFGVAEFTRNPDEGQTAFHEFFGLEFDGAHRVIFLYYLILFLALFVNAFSLRIRRLPIGRSWEALREDDIACQSLGINRRNIKLAAFTISAMFGGFAGSFFATRQAFISPESFTFIESAIILSIVVLGGMGSQTGVVLAAILLIGLPEMFRELADYRMLAFGAAMVGIMVWRPRGLLAHRDPTVRLDGGRPGRGKRPTAEAAKA